MGGGVGWVEGLGGWEAGGGLYLSIGLFGASMSLKADTVRIGIANASESTFVL